MHAFVYPARFTPDEDDGGFMVTFRDLPEAITQGDSVGECIREARDCLEEAIANRIAMDLDIPEPSAPEEEEYPIALVALLAAKASLHAAMREESMTKVELANRLHCDEKAIRRLLDPSQASKIPRIESALEVFHRQLVIGVQSAKVMRQA